LYPPLLLGVLLLVTLQVSVFSAGLGIVISLRSTTTRAAQQTMSILVFVLIIPLFLLSFLPREILFNLGAMLATFNVAQFTTAAIIALFVVDGALILYNISQFRREKLISE
jgi:ABC-type Na+ efflux pump permease subunit